MTKNTVECKKCHFQIAGSYPRHACQGDEKVGDSEKVVEKWGMYKEGETNAKSAV